MVNRPMFIATGLTVAVVEICMLVVFFQAVRKEEEYHGVKRLLVKIGLASFFIFFYFGAFWVLQQIERTGILGTLTGDDRLSLAWLWVAPTAIAMPFFGIRHHRWQKRKALNSGVYKKKEENDEKIPSRLQWVLKSLLPVSICYYFFIARKPITLASYSSEKVKAIFFVIWFLPQLFLWIRLEMKIYKMKKQKKEALAEENISPTTT